MMRRRLFLISTFILLTGLIGWYCANQLDTPTSPTSDKATNPSPGGALSLNNSGSPDVPLAQEGFPDLTVDSARLKQSIEIVTRTIDLTNCAVVEGCASAGARRLLLFDVAMPNFGNADLVVGNPRKNPSLFEYSPCHRHYHYKNFSEYRLKDGSNVVIRSHKQAFCFEDVLRYWNGYPKHGYNCNKQGISVGWADLYGKYLDCQWIDITDVNPGNYSIEVEINMAGAFDEGPNTYPNIVRVPVTIPSS